ncbi:unnamed protein product, partial [Didymodactylos carnosus]
LEQALISDAFEVVKSVIMNLESNFSFPSQNCVWHDFLSSSSFSPDYNSFLLNSGEMLLKKFHLAKYHGNTGTIEFDLNGTRKYLKLKILDFDQHGVREIGSYGWNDDSLTIRSLGQKKITEIRRHLQVVTREEKPYVSRIFFPNGTVQFEGYCIDMLNHIAKELNFNYSLRVVSDGNYGKEEDSTGKWTGIIGELVDRNADLGVGALTITSAREKVIDFTKPFMNFGITILFRKPLRTKPNLFAFLAPLSLEVWLCMGAAYVGVSFFLFSMARLSPYEWQSPYSCKRNSDYIINRFTIMNCFWFCVGSLMKQNIDYGPKSLCLRTLIGSWWFFSLIMIASYTANLAAFLTTKRLKSPIDDVEALAKQTEIKYGALKGGSTEQFFRSSKLPLYERMWYYMSSKPDVFMITTEEGINRVKNENYAFLLESATNEYNVQRHCELMQVGGLIESKSYGIGTAHGSPYRDLISDVILKMQENGVLSKMYDTWWKERNVPVPCDDLDVDKRKKHFTNELDLKNIGIYKSKNTWKQHIKEELYFTMCTGCRSRKHSQQPMEPQHNSNNNNNTNNNNDEVRLKLVPFNHIISSN